MKPNRTWKVADHGPLEPLAANVWSVSAVLKAPLVETNRRMTVARLRNGGLVIYSAISLREAEMAKLEALGKPAFLVVPSAIHRLDAAPWKQRYPDLVVVAPAGARAQVGEVVGIDCTQVDLGDPDVRIFSVPGTADRELAMAAGKTLVVNDLIFNMPRYRGIRRLVFRLLGFGPGKPTIPKLVAKKLVADERAVKSELRRWANTGYERLVVAHGAPIENPREVLLGLAT